MKIKGITIWEMHAEKLVLGVAAAAFVAFAGLQFIGDQNAQPLTGVPGKTSVSPREVDRFFAERADELLNKLRGTTAQGQGVGTYEPQASTVEQLLTNLPLPTDALPRLVYGLPLPINMGLGVANRPYLVPQPPTPEIVARCQYADALDPEVVRQTPPLLGVFGGKDEPYDLAWVTVRQRWNKAQYLRQLRGETMASDQGDMLAVPKPWHNDQTLILDVLMEREELVDGQWTNLSVIDPLPGHFSLRTTLAGDIRASQREQMLQDVATPARQGDIAQPEFYATRNNSWSLCEPQQPEDADVQAVGLVPEQALVLEIAKVQRDLAKKEAEIKRRKDTLEKAGGPLEDEPIKPVSPPAGGSGGKGKDGGGEGPPGGGFGPAGGAGKARDEDTQKATDAKRRNLTRALRSLERDAERIRNKISELRAQLPAAAVPTGPGEAPAAADRDGDVVDLWCHDITARPGLTYRYRIVVKLSNPFYGKKLNLIESQKHLADSLTTDSPPSAWCDPITVSPWLRFFVVAAKPPRDDAGLGLGKYQHGQVNAEVYRFFNGQWRQETFTVEPGDRLGSVRHYKPSQGPVLPIDFSTNLYVVDVVENIGAQDVDRTSSRASFVILQAVDGSSRQLRDPRSEIRDSDRSWLQEQVRLSELAGAGPA